MPETVPSLPEIDGRGVSERAYAILREYIISKKFSPGQRLNLPAIETQLGISRTPLREALALLETEGLVEVAPRRGTFVTGLSPEQVAESFEVRKALELYAIEHVVKRASDQELGELQAMVQALRELTDAEDRDAIYPRYLALDHEFHSRLVELAGNRRLSACHARENVHAQMARIRYRSSERGLEVAQDEHERLVAALLRRDSAAAVATMDAHLERAKQSILADME